MLREGLGMREDKIIAFSVWTVKIKNKQQGASL
jgi:hypothetical protein